MKLILQIALGVSLGIILGGSFLYLYTGAFAEQLISIVLKQSVAQNTLAKPRSSAVVSLLDSNNKPAPPLPIASESVEPATAQSTSTILAPIAEMNIAGKDAVVIADKEDQRQMAIKFKAYYKKTDKCQSPNEDHNLLVACGNEYIRAKAKFEELWQQGEFKK